MIIKIDFQSDIPIYTQLKYQIIEGIAKSSLQRGEMLPSVRQMAQDIGINMHTVNKAYNNLRQEGFIQIHRQKGVFVNPEVFKKNSKEHQKKLESDLRPIIAEAIAKGFTINEIQRHYENVYNSIINKKED